MPEVFAPLLVPPGGSSSATVRLAGETGSGPLLVEPDTPLGPEVAPRSLALLAAWSARSTGQACLGADGNPAGADAPRACPVSPRGRERLAAAAAAALEAGFAGVALDRPDATLALGLLGAGFCEDCQRDFQRELSREYGEQLGPVDYLRLAREAVAQASGAVSFEVLPFGRDFWRFRSEAVVRSVAALARAARDHGRVSGRAVHVSARFSAIGPAQAAAARHLDSAIFPAELAQGIGAGELRLLRALMGGRPCAAELPAASGEELGRAATLAAACGVAVLPASDEAARTLAPLRRFAAELSSRRDAPAPGRPVPECAVLYSAESDLWTGGRHRLAVQQALASLAAVQVQAAAVLDVAEAAPPAVLVLAGAEALSPAEAHAVQRHLGSGGAVLALGPAAAVDGAGRPAFQPFLPEGKPAGVRVGEGTFVELPSPAPGPPGGPATPQPLAGAVQALVGRGVRSASILARGPVHVSLCRNGDLADVHLVSLDSRPLHGATLFLGVHVVGSPRRARFQSAEGADERIPVNPSGYSVSTVLPAFRGWAVLSLPG